MSNQQQENVRAITWELNDPRWLHTSERRRELCRRYTRAQRLRAAGGFLTVGLFLGIIGRKWLALGVLLTAPVLILGVVKYKPEDIKRD